MTEVRPLSKAPRLLPWSKLAAPAAPGVCELGWVKCREHISLLVILCIIVYVTNKAHLKACGSVVRTLRYACNIIDM